MPIELIKNPLKAFSIIGENVYSTVVEEDVNVPDINPDLHKVLATSARVMIKNCEIMPDKVMVNGVVVVGILYSADIEGKPLFSMEVPLSFSQGIEMPGAMPKMKEQVNPIVQNVDCSIINSRKLNLRIIMDIHCKVEDLFDINTAGDVRGLPDIQLLREPFHMKQLAGNSKDQYTIKEEMEIEEEKPPINNILKTDCRLKSREYDVHDGKIEVNGILSMNMLYTTDNQEGMTQQMIEQTEVEIPFSQYIEMPSAEKSMEPMVDFSIGESRVNVKENEEGQNKLLEVEVDMSVKGKVFNNVEIDVVTDAYSPTCQMDIGKDLIKMFEMVCASHGSMVMKETMTVKSGEPEIEKVSYVDAVAIISEIKIVDDKIVVEGMIEATAVYITSFSGEPMCSMKEQIPFRHTIDTPGSRLGMLSNVKTEVESVTHSYMNSQMIELRIVIHTTIEVYKPIEKRMIVKVQEIEGIKPDASKMPAVTIYLVQKGDSLWTIAKRYNTTVDALVKLNNIENPAKIYPGMQILVLKGIRVG